MMILAGMTVVKVIILWNLVMETNPKQKRHPRACGDLMIMKRSKKMGFPVKLGMTVKKMIVAGNDE